MMLVDGWGHCNKVWHCARQRLPSLPPGTEWPDVSLGWHGRSWLALAGPVELTATDLLHPETAGAVHRGLT